MLKPYDNRSDSQFDTVEIVYDFFMMRAACATKIACDNRKQKSYRVNRPLEISITKVLAPVVQRVGSAIHWISCYAHEMKYVGETRYSHMNLIQNEGKSRRIIGLCKNLAKSIKWNMLAALDGDLSSE